MKHQGNINGKKTRLYSIWLNMRQRCNDPNATSYKYYGAKGVQVLWASFEEFKRDMQDGYAETLTLDRRDTNGHYCKSNCRWATAAEQNRNYGRNVNITFNGKTQCLTDWSKETGIRYSVLQRRIELKWPIDRLLTTPVKPPTVYTINGVTHNIQGWAKILNTTEKVLYARLGRGWTIEDALTTPVKLLIRK